MTPKLKRDRHLPDDAFAARSHVARDMRRSNPGAC